MIQLLQKIDWINAVFLPLCMGIPLSIYAGIVGARLVTFQQTKTAAMYAFIDLATKTANDSKGRWETYLLCFLQAAQLTFVSERQHKAAAKLAAINNEIFEAYKLALPKAEQRFVQQYPNLTDHPDRWMHEAVSAFDSIKDIPSRKILQVGSIKPELYAIFGIHLSDYFDFTDGERTEAKKHNVV
ncbi:MAG: hypothetical protein K0R17_2240 [Rariglobus sp.]|jgi:hypothetical protein|nr:hypothetical protein [Rariglobus sp.]